MRRAWRISSSSGGMSFGTHVVGVPGPHQQVGQEAANGDEERPGAHGRVADLQVEDLFGSGVWAEAFQDRPEGRLDDRLGEGPRRVVRARPPALVGRLEHHGPGRNDPGRGSEAHLTLQGRDGVLGRGRLLQRSGGLARHGLVGSSP